MAKDANHSERQPLQGLVYLSHGMYAEQVEQLQGLTLPPASALQEGHVWGWRLGDSHLALCQGLSQVEAPHPLLCRSLLLLRWLILLIPMRHPA